MEYLNSSVNKNWYKALVYTLLIKIILVAQLTCSHGQRL